MDVHSHAHGAMIRFIYASLLTSIAVAQPSGAQRLTAELDSVMKAAEKTGFSGVVRIEKGGALVLE